MNIYTANFEVRPMDIQHNFACAKEHLDKAIAEKCDIIVYPQGFLIGTSFDVLLGNEILQQQYNKNADKLCSSIWLSKIVILCDNLTPQGFVNAFYSQGKKLGTDVVTIGRFSVAYCNSFDEMFDENHDFRKKADVFLINISKPCVAGQLYLYINAMQEIADNLDIIFVLCTGGRGYSTHPFYFAPAIGCVKKLESNVATDYQAVQKASFVQKISPTRPLFTNKCSVSGVDFDIAYNQNPLIPANVDTQKYCLELFEMQAVSLATRLKNINCQNLVLNLSGGLDSSLALLVCVNTLNILNLDKNNLQVITMPSFGTSDKTKLLAANLCESLGLKLITIDIKKACETALLDIGHSTEQNDIVFENVQARMRTLYALNLANKHNALMVGTGDLSEEALGFATYGGDQFASYNINSCISKTVIRTMLPYITDTPLFASAKEVIKQILALPVSPELTQHGGEILQKTEEILAPYKLIDFYIYCFLVAKISPEQTIEKAKEVFKEEFSTEYLTEKLKMFYKRYVTGQFKRSASPETAAITHVSLFDKNAFYPSDSSPNFLIDML